MIANIFTAISYFFLLLVSLPIAAPIVIGLVALENVTGSPTLGACRQDVKDVIQEIIDRFLNHIYCKLFGVSPERGCPIAETLTRRVERW